VGSCLIREFKGTIFPWAILYKTASFAVFAGESLIALPLTILREAIDGLWFLWALLASLILTAMIKAMRWQFWPVYVLTGVIVLLLPDGGNLTMFKYMFPYFGAGYCVASWGNRVLPPKCEWALFLGASVASVTLYCLWNKQTYISSSGMALVEGNYYNVLLRFAAGLFASISMLFVMNHLFHRTPVWLKHLIEQFGQDSIYIYIVQVYVFKVILRLAHAYDPFTNRVVGQVVAVVMGIGVAWLCWMGGRLLSTNETLGLILFGKPRKHPAGFDVGAGQRTP
jgi:fucose 4-O-acetylase-like acetyltransferase